MSARRPPVSYYVSEWWRDRRRRYFETHLRRCIVCGSENRVELHHLTYLHLFAERDDDLVPMCHVHHKRTHKAIRAGKCELKRSHVYMKRAHERRRPKRKRRVA